VPSTCSWGSCVNGCSGHGACVAGACACTLGYFTPDCSLRMPDITPGIAKNVAVSSSRWAYYVFNVNAGTTAWSLAFRGTADPDYYVARGRVPTLTDYDYKDVTVGAIASIRPSSVVSGMRRRVCLSRRLPFVRRQMIGSRLFGEPREFAAALVASVCRSRLWWLKHASMNVYVCV
jgi:hypothetical protein